jgi:hypothetical protein
MRFWIWLLTTIPSSIWFRNVVPGQIKSLFLAVLSVPMRSKQLCKVGNFVSQNIHPDYAIAIKCFLCPRGCRKAESNTFCVLHGSMQHIEFSDDESGVGCLSSPQPCRSGFIEAVHFRDKTRGF